MDPTKSKIFNFLIIGLGLLLLLSLNSCGHMPISSMVKLRNVDVQTTDLNKLRVAAQMPIVFKPFGKGVVMTASLEKTTSLPTIIEIFKLQQASTPDKMQELVDYKDTGKKIYIFKIASADIVRFERFRNMKAQGNNGIKRKGSLSVSTNICRKMIEKPSSINVSTFLKTSETQEFVPLLLNVDLLKQSNEKDIDLIAPICG